jgi:hypothetical protein
VNAQLALVRITHQQFVDLSSQINVKETLDAGSTLAVSGLHPVLGQVVLFDSASGGRVAALPHTSLKFL